MNIQPPDNSPQAPRDNAASSSLRDAARTHFTACCVAFSVLVVSRYVAFRSAGPDAILLTPSPVGLVADFLTAVLALTFFRVLYGIPLLLVRPSLRRIGAFVLFTLVFSGIFALRTQQAIGARVEPGAIRVIYPFPAASVVIPVKELLPPRLRETSAVKFIDIPETSVRFVPAFRFDTTGEARLRSLFNALTTATAPAA